MARKRNVGAPAPILFSISDIAVAHGGWSVEKTRELYAKRKAIFRVGRLWYSTETLIRRRCSEWADGLLARLKS